MAKKNNLKSVRMSDEVLSYVLNFEGEGFNQKFENLVLFCMQEEDRKRQELYDLDEKLGNMRSHYDALYDLRCAAASCRGTLSRIEHTLQLAADEIDARYGH